MQRTADIQIAEDFTFSKFMLSDKLLKSLNKMNFIKPSPIQLKVVPLAKCGLDMIIQAKSGTGKTLAFAICLLESYEADLKFPQSLVVVPTREIAVQIFNVLNELGSNVKHFKAFEFIGGTEIADDRKKIQSAKVVVGTPGRILHLIKNEIFNISNLKTLVLDEADKLLEGGQMGKDVKAILAIMPKKIQILATTATVTKHLERVMKQVMKNPIGITPKHEIPVLLGIKQFVKVLPSESDNIQLMNAKIDELHKIFTRITFKQCLLFTDSQSKTESYGNYLKKRGWKNEVINGAQDQSQRLHVLDKLIKFECRILISTDLMARGIDIENINLIINLDLPFDCFTYLHRIGRAGRFGTHGIAITFVDGENNLKKFQKMLGDIGGNSLKALKFPDESLNYDFWNFKQADGDVLGTISGVTKDGEAFDDESQIQQNGIDSEEDQTLLDNIALLEITRKLIDGESQKPDTFNLNSILADYEETIKNSDGGADEGLTATGDTSINLEDENLFLKTIGDLHLYEDEEKLKESEESSECQEPIATQEERHVIFKRPADEEVSTDSSASDDSSCEDDEESVPTKQASKKLKEEENCHQFHNNYQQFVASNYSQWENIYYYQLANIESYVKSARK